MNGWWLPPTIRDYRASWLSADIFAGLTLVAVALPSQMATARLASLPAIVGLYAFIAGSLLYALIGSSRHLSVGADSTIAPILATSIASVVAIGTPRYDTLMAFFALLIGGLLVVVGLLRLGWISELLSTPVITGILGGIAVEIVARQLSVILGIKGAGGSTIDRVRGVVDQISHTNLWTLVTALGVFAIIELSRRVDRRAPGALLALIVSIGAVYIFGLSTDHRVQILGSVHGGLPHLRLSTASWSEVGKLVAPSLTVAFVCIAQTAATVRASSAGAPAKDDFNRDLIGVGAGSLGAGLLGAFAVDASPPNTAIMTASGARTQLSNIMAAAAVLIVVVFATAPLSHVPAATLGATLVYIASKLFRTGELRSIFAYDRTEFALAGAALLAVALIGIEQGVALAIALSLADRTRRVARPRDTILGREPGTDHWIPTDIGSVTEQVPGVLVYLVYAPLWYGNADYLHLRVRELVDRKPQVPIRAVVIDADAISDIDYTGLQSLRGLTAELEAEGVTITIARASHLVHHDLKHGALNELLGPGRLFTSVEEAVAFHEH